MKKLLALIAVAACVACGKRGDPHPPVPVIPQATNDLAVVQHGSRVLLSWSYPSLTVAGKSLGAIRREVIYRYTEELPVEQPPRNAATNILPGDIDPTQPQAIALFAKVPRVGPQQFNRLKEKLETIETEALAGATGGAKLTFEDTPEFHAKDGRPLRVNYAIVTEGMTARSELSNIATIVPIDVPTAPLNLAASAKPEGVVLTWSAPTDKTRILGYNIYRTTAGETLSDLATPVNSAPVAETTYTDTPSYGNFEYRVAAVSAPRIESDLSEAAKATFKDLVPPTAPTGLTALVETKAIRLLWDSVEAPDLAGYKIYRTEGTGVQQLTPVATIALTPAPITATNYRDTQISIGISYYYEVASVDKSGNESKRVKTDWVLAPKTP